MASEVVSPKRLFFSYAHEDSDLRDQLEQHLTQLKREGAITAWHDRDIGAGTEWSGQISEELEAADIILLLVSAPFLASAYAYDKEVYRALQRHERGEAIVIPVILRPVGWERTPFGKLQALPRDARPVTKWRNRDEALKDVATGIAKAVTRLGRPQASVTRARHVLKDEDATIAKFCRT